MVDTVLEIDSMNNQLLEVHILADLVSFFTELYPNQALKVDMIVETMWPDVAMKCIPIFWEKDEEKKASMNKKLAQVMTNCMIKEEEREERGGCHFEA